MTRSHDANLPASGIQTTGYRRAACNKVAQQCDLLRLLDYDALRESAQAGIAAVQKLEPSHLDRALMMWNHRARKIAVCVSARRNAHSGVHLNHDGAQRTVEFICKSRSRSGEQLTLDVGRQRREGHRDGNAGNEGAGVRYKVSYHVPSPNWRLHAREAVPARTVPAACCGTPWPASHLAPI